MTLKEKFQNILIDWINEYYNREHVAELIEIYSDDYAIEFAEWVDDNYFRSGKGSGNWVASLHWDDDEKFTTKQLLKIFKKEKGL